MNAKRAKYATLTASSSVKEEAIPILIQESNEDDEPHQEYTYATFADEHGRPVTIQQLVENEDEAAVAALQHHHHDGLTGAQEIIIDEHGRAITIHQLMESNDVEEVEAVEEHDGTHTILHIVPSSQIGEEHVIEDGSVIIEQEEDMHDPNISAGESLAGRSKTFYCTNCGNCYSAAGSLKLHMRACMRRRQEVPAEERKCEICNKIFNSVAYLKEHMLRHTGEGPRRCSRCYRKFVDEEKLKSHMETHTQQDKLDAEADALAAAHGGKKVVLKEFNCSFCSQNFTVVFEAGQVKRRYACDDCRDKYSNADMLKRHKQMVDDKREFHCERCGRKFVFEGFLQRHLPTCDGTIKRRRDMK